MPAPAQPASTAHTCLLGEADPFLALLLQRFAENCGLQVQRAQTGEAILALAQSQPPAVVILDPELPGKLRGWEAARRLQEDPATAGLPLVLCAWLPAAEAQAQAGSPLPHLQKPDLHFEAFREALAAAGLEMGN